MRTAAPTTPNDTALPLANALERLVGAVETLQHQQETLWQQSESLVRLLSLLKPQALFPATRGWAASPDFLLLLAETILATKPTHIIEASSGVSTVVSAYCLKRLGSGRVTALEHDPEYVDATNTMLSSHGLTSIATVVHAPLVEHVIDGETYQWYDITDVDPIDLLVVDGPPARTGPLARYPAVPILRHRFKDDAIVLVDDGARPPEKEMVRRWCAALPTIEAEYLDFEKGAFRLQF